MKKLNKILVLTLVGGLFLFACSKEKTIKKHITGAWTATMITIVKTDSSGVVDTETDDSKNDITFNDDGTGTAHISSSGSSRTVIPDNFTWSNTDETLTIDDDDSSDTFVFDIIEESKTNMKIKNTRDDQGTQIETTIEMSKD